MVTIIIICSNISFYNNIQYVRRNSFSVIFILLALLFLSLFISGIIFPWNFPHELQLQSLKVDYIFFHFYYSASVLNFALSSQILKYSMSKTPSWIFKLFAVVTFLLTLCTVVIFYQYSISNYILYWLPTLPSAIFAFVFYIDSDIKNLSRDVNQLENLKYEFKKV